MKKIPRDSNWHYLKWLGIFVVSILLVGIVINLDRSLSFFSFLFTAISPVLLGLLIAMILKITNIYLFITTNISRMRFERGGKLNKIYDYELVSE